MHCERKIHFYRCYLKHKNERTEPYALDTNSLINKINSLSFEDNDPNQSAYLFDGDDILCGWIDELQKLPKLRFGRIRRNNLPQVECAGKLSDLILQKDSGLVDQTHIVFFSNGIIGAEYNYHGPRISKLAKYLQKKADLPSNITFAPLVHNNILEQLDSLQNLSLIDLKIAPSVASLLYQADKDLGSAFEAAGRFTKGQPVEMILRPKKTDTNFFKKFVLALKKILLKEDFQQGVQKFHLKGEIEESNQTAVIDLLHSQIVMKKNVLLLNDISRSVDKNSAYKEIIGAYNELRDEIEKSPGII